MTLLGGCLHAVTRGPRLLYVALLSHYVASIATDKVDKRAGGTWRTFLEALLPMSHWSEISHLTPTYCKGGWEM